MELLIDNIEFSEKVIEISENKLSNEILEEIIKNKNDDCIYEIEIDKNKIDKEESEKEEIIKKKKGRKSKKNKLEIENKKIKPVRLFPTLNKKIFDVIKINNNEYFFDTDFNILLDNDVIPIGFKENNKFIFYSEVDENIKQIKKDNKEVKKILDKII